MGALLREQFIMSSVIDDIFTTKMFSVCNSKNLNKYSKSARGAPVAHAGGASNRRLDQIAGVAELGH